MARVTSPQPMRSVFGNERKRARDVADLADDDAEPAVTFPVLIDRRCLANLFAWTPLSEIGVVQWHEFRGVKRRKRKVGPVTWKERTS